MVEMLGDFCGELMSLHDTCPGQEGCKDGVRLDSSIIAEKMKQHTLYICFSTDFSVFENTVFNHSRAVLRELFSVSKIFLNVKPVIRQLN